MTKIHLINTVDIIYVIISVCYFQKNAPVDRARVILPAVNSI
jgi:hypothetical protein